MPGEAPIVIVLLGVSGAGKTTVGQALAASLGFHFADADAYHSASNVAKMRSGIPLTDDDRAPWLQALNLEVRQWVATASPTVLACSGLKRAYRDVLRDGVADSAIRFVFLQVSPEQLAERLHQRQGHYMPESLLASQLDALEIPAPEEALRVDAKGEVNETVAAILRGLDLPAATSKALH